jgi:hypothetical protein
MAALFGTFFLSMPLTIVGGEFHSIFLTFRKEQEDQNNAILEALKTEHDSVHELEGAKENKESALFTHDTPFQNNPISKRSSIGLELAGK